MTNSEFDRLKRRIASAKEDKIRAEENLRIFSQKLQKDYGCKTLAQAKKKLKELEKAADTKQAALQESLEHLEKEYDRAD
jgi:hypothetical protein